jgi:hypothetical protein
VTSHYERRQAKRLAEEARRNDPNLRVNVLMALETEEARQLYAEQGYLTVKQVSKLAEVMDTDIIESALLTSKWHRRGQKWRPGKRDPILYAPGEDADDIIRLAVGKSDVPPEHHAELVRRIMNSGREWEPTRGHINYEIRKFKKELTPPAPTVSDLDQALLDDINAYLELPEVEEILNSRPQRYLTGAEIIEGAWGTAVTYKALRDVARVLPWKKQNLKVDGKQIAAYIQPPVTGAAYTPPKLDGLLEYLKGRYAVMEYDVLRDVCGIGSKQIRTWDLSHLRQAMIALRWRRERSRHTRGRGWCYTKVDLTG